MDKTLGELAAEYSLTNGEVKRLRGAAFSDSLDAPLGTLAGGVVYVADDWRFANWLKRVREANPS